MSLAVRIGCAASPRRFGRCRAYFFDIPRHFETREEFDIAGQPPNFARAHALCPVGGRKLGPAFLQLIAGCFLTVDARL